MKLSRFVNTTGFRLSALYMALFLFSFITVGGTVYVLSQRILDQQARDAVASEISVLRAEYVEGGLPALQREIDEKQRTVVMTGAAHQYGVLDAGGDLLAGTVGNVRLSAGWQDVSLSASGIKGRDDDNDDDDFLKVELVSLSGGYWLGVGYHADYIEDALDAIVVAFSKGGLLVLVLGVAGGYILIRSFLGKIGAITKSTQAIIAGDLNHRLSIGKSRDELDNLAALMNRMLDEICDLIDNIRQVSSDIAHDLRTPLGHLKFRLEETLQAELTPDEYRKKMADMVRDVDQILNTFAALLRIAQIESGSRRAGFSDIDLSAIIENVADALEPVAEEKGKTLQRNLLQGVCFSGDKELLTQMAYNLVENAIVHSGEGRHVSVDLLKEEASVVLSISDDGPGIPDDQKDKVFRRFYRIETSRATPGNGLGLNIVAAIADLHGAEINLSDNKPGLMVRVAFISN